MGEKEDVMKGLHELKENLSKTFPIEKMIFFGSRAKGNCHRDSDIDVVIVSRGFEGKRFRDRSLGFYKHWVLDYPADFLCYTPQEFSKRSTQVTILREAVKEGIEVN